MVSQVLLVASIKARPAVRGAQLKVWHSLVEGVGFLWGRQVVLSAVVTIGIGTLLVVLAVWRGFPQLRSLKGLSDLRKGP